ncbi:MAG: DUF3107 domain-containing protein [Acidobacteria bacterium]|nr:DUF3107 domain-containing protein [Acidobacteriota bacterium]
MDVRIGVTYTAKELDVELPSGSETAEIKAQVEAALTGGAGSVLWLTDHKGRQVGVPVEKIAYVDIGSSSAERRIGFAGS